MAIPATNGKAGPRQGTAQTVNHSSEQQAYVCVASSQNGVKSKPAGSTPDFSDGSNQTKHSKSPRTQNFPRVSLPVEMMRKSYDVVVIGTGYGGSVAASRMARGKQSVCVLERGKERWPGEFPETLIETAKEIRVNGEFAPGDRRGIPGKPVDGGNPTGLYNFVVGEGQNVFQGSGLGGTSLINANIFLEAHPDVLDSEVWPEELRGRDAWAKCEFYPSRSFCLTIKTTSGRAASSSQRNTHQTTLS